MTLLWLSAALALGTAGGAAAAEADAPRQLTIGVEDLRYYPLHSSNNGSVFSGYARDVLDAFAKQQGYSFRYVPLPINRLYVAFLEGALGRLQVSRQPEVEGVLARLPAAGLQHPAGGVGGGGDGAAHAARPSAASDQVAGHGPGLYPVAVSDRD
ncbi:hypothetical protein LP419_40440 [Massilia sp. H-1]|nr:hypothetical protein LP419_40440 [Massilia sp. H-1]